MCSEGWLKRAPPTRLSAAGSILAPFGPDLNHLRIISRWSDRDQGSSMNWTFRIFARSRTAYRRVKVYLRRADPRFLLPQARGSLGRGMVITCIMVYMNGLAVQSAKAKQSIMTKSFPRSSIAEESSFSRMTEFQGQKAGAWSSCATQAFEAKNRCAERSLPSQREGRPGKRKISCRRNISRGETKEKRPADDFARLHPS